jgi:hypothetical protein
MRNLATFEADFEDDAVLDSKQNIVSPAGQNIAMAIASHLSTLGYECSEPEQHSFYGWCFDVCWERERFWLLLQGGDPWLLICERNPTILQRLFRRRDEGCFNSFLLAVDTALKADTRFTDIRWFSRDDFEAKREDATSEFPG